MRLVNLLLLFLAAQPAVAAEPAVTPLYEPAMILRTSNVRADPSTGQPPLDTFGAGTQVLITGIAKDARGRDWYAVSLYDGRRGYIYGNLAAPLPDFPEPPEGLGTTEIRDAAAAARLVGAHGTVLSWIGAQPWGELAVFEDLGLYYLQGGQSGDGKAARDSMTLSGYVTRIDAEGFTLQGTLAYDLYQFDRPIHCERKGVHRFVRLPDSNTWRLAGKATPCGEWEDRVDVYLRKE